MLFKKKLLRIVPLIFCMFLLYSCKGGVSNTTTTNNNTNSELWDTNSTNIIFENPNPVKKIDQKAIQNTLSEKLWDWDFIKEVVEVWNREQVILDKDFFEQKYGAEFRDIAVSYYSFLVHKYDTRYFNIYWWDYTVSLSTDGVITDFEQKIYDEEGKSVFLIKSENSELLKYLQDYKNLLESEKKDMVDVSDFGFLDKYEFIHKPDLELIRVSDMYDIVVDALDTHFITYKKYDEYVGMWFEDFLDSIEIK